MKDFWTRLDRLLEENQVVIDRTRGSRHPRFPDLIYPLDYGYLDGTTGGDGGGINVWRGSMSEAGLGAVGCTVDSHKRDAEIKLLLGCTEEEIEIISRLYNLSEDMSMVIVRRERQQ